MYRPTQDGQFKHLKNMSHLRLNFWLPAINDSGESIFQIFELEYLREFETKQKSFQEPTKGLGGTPFMKRKKL